MTYSEQIDELLKLEERLKFIFSLMEEDEFNEVLRDIAKDLSNEYKEKLEALRKEKE